MKRSTPQDRNVGAKIREFRVARSWKQSELASQLHLHCCDLSREIIALIESGYLAVSVYEIDKFVEVFGITYDELFAK